MKRLLHIIATPRELESRTLQISVPFIETFQENHPNWIIDELNLCKEELPSLTLKQVGGKYVLLEGKDLYGTFKEAWMEIVQHIERFKTADMFLLSTPMWNFHIPYILKHYIDIIVQPRYLFRYREDGTVEGLVQNKKMIIITSRGGDYSKDNSFDFQEPYLRGIFGFVGIQDIECIKAEPMDMGIDVQKEKIEAAINTARELARRV